MRLHRKNITLLIFILISLGVWQSASLYSQTPIGTRIDNAARMAYQYRNGTADSLQSNTASVVVQGNSLLSFSKSVAPSSGATGDTVMFTLVVAVSGTANVPGVLLIDTIPAQFNVVAANHGTIIGPIVTWNIGTLAAGTSDTLQIITVLKPNIPAGSVITNNGFVADSSGTRVTSFVDFAVTTIPQLVLTKSVSKDTVVSGDDVRYTILVRNTGNSTLNSIMVIDTLPPQLTNIVVSPNAVLNSRIVTYQRNALPYGTADSIIIDARVSGNQIGGNAIRNIAHGITNETSLISAEAISVIRSVPITMIEKTVSRDTTQYGDTLHYVIRYRNTGNVTLNTVVVSDTLPLQLTALSVSLNAQVTNGIISASIDSLTIGGEDSILVEAKVTSILGSNQTITNAAYIRSAQASESFSEARTYLSTSPLLFLTKSVSNDSAFAGDTIRYSIVFRNTGNIPLTNFTISDTIPFQLTVIGVSVNAQLQSGTVQLFKDTLHVNESDSIFISSIIRANRPGNEQITNTVSASANATPRQIAQASTIVKPPVTTGTCKLVVTALPRFVAGNGVHVSNLSAFLSDSLGNPKPDGTSVFFFSSAGVFSNGQPSIIHQTVNGFVADSLRLLITNNQLTTALVTASSDDSSVCRASDTVTVVFYAGALKGVVVDQGTGQPVSGADVKIFTSSNALVGSHVTVQNGQYVQPLTATDDYRTSITAGDEFGRNITTSTILHVDVPATGGNLPQANLNAVSGALYFGASHGVIITPNTRVLLFSTPGMIPVDSTTTDSLGVYRFIGIAPGTYQIEVNGPQLFGGLTITNNGNGEYLINANIPIVLNPSISFVKSGPAQVSARDTVTYTLSIQNNGGISLTGAIVVDTLDPLMRFVSASLSGVYEAQSHRIVWTIGQIGSTSILTLNARVAFDDTVSSTTTLSNRARFTSNEITALRSEAITRLNIPAQLRIWKTVSTTQANPGDTISYAIHIANVFGPRADSVTITDDLPEEVTYISSLPTASYNLITRRATWTLDSLVSGSQQLLTMRVVLRNDLTPGEHRFTNVAETQWSGGNASSSLDALSKSSVSIVVPFLQITKQAIRKIVEVGDIATYVVKIMNLSPATSARNVAILDRIPFGFKYINGSSFRDSITIADPSGSQELRWDLIDSLKPGTSIQLMYRLTVGAGGLEGNGLNEAEALAELPTGESISSGKVGERVEIRRGVFTDRGFVIGKVFYDDNENRYQDPGEPGIKGVELMTEDGTRIITGDDGKYSITDIAPGEHVIRVREHTLPKHSQLLLGYDEFAKNASSRFVKVAESGIARADFYVKHSYREPVPISVTQSVAKMGLLEVHRLANPKNLVFVREEGAAAIKLTGSQFEAGKATLKPEAFPTLKAVADLAREFADQTISISGHTDSKPIHTKEFPSNQELSEARARAVKMYLVREEYIDSTRIATIGFSSSQPVISNKTNEGRAQNRRVEISLSGSRNDTFNRYIKTVQFSLPIDYEGSASLSRVEIQDNLDTLLHFVNASANVDGQEIKPVVNGSTLSWSVENLGQSFHKTLTYQARVDIPTTKVISVQSTTTVSYIASNDSPKIAGTIRTINQIATASKGKALNYVLSGVLFDVGKATLKPEAVRMLKAAAEVLTTYPQAKAVIEGYTDSKPIKTKEFSSNVALSHARSTTVLELLAKDFGIDTIRMQAFGWGELKPVASNASEQGRQSNRRVEIKVYKKEFAEETIPEGLVDSSETLQTGVDPTHHPEAFDGTASGSTTDKFVFRLSVLRQNDPETISMALIDSLPPGLTIVPNSVVKLRGIDTVIVNSGSFSAMCSASDSVSSVSFIGELKPSSGLSIEHWFTVRRIRVDGTIDIDRAKPIILKIRQ